MCGIAGIVGNVEPEDRRRVGAMNDILFHRGPDAGGLQAYEGAVLGHRRLSIIDLTARAAQPMQSDCGRYALVFNGEIYNYRELRAELQTHVRFRSDSDTEVLLAAWQVWGEACLDRLNGMFAFCVYDVEARSAFLARDRFGQKPLFLSERNGRLLFASEVKAILAAGVPARPDLETWARYLVTASYDDTAQSFFAGVTQLLPGECAHYDPHKGLRRRHYYRIADQISPVDHDVETAADRVREIIVDACRIHMRADVPVGIMLSGGLDSSAMLAGLDMAGELHAGVKCFSVEFGETLTERPWIEAAARHHGLPSRIDRFEPRHYLDSIKPMMWHLEAPIGGLMNCGLRAVMEAARADGFTVLQDGSGPDECFAGYQNHHNLYLGLLLKDRSVAADKAIGEYARNWGVDEATARRAAEQALERRTTAIDGTIPVRPDLLTDGFAEHPMATPPDVAYSGDRLRDALIEYMQGSKIPRNTRMVDRLSMGYGLELRLPYLDHRLVEYGLSLPAAYYYLDGRTKGILRLAMQQEMDDSVRLATKRSIQAPQGPWLMDEPMRDYVDDLLKSDSFASRGIFDVPRARAAFDEFCAGKYDNSFFVWQWINVEEWFRIFIDCDAVTKLHRLVPELAAEDAGTRATTGATIETDLGG